MEPNSPYSALIHDLQQKYVLESGEMLWKNYTIRYIRPASIDDLLDEYAELVQQDDKMPYWAYLWESAIALTRIILDRYDFAGAPVLELGSGLGIGGIAAALKNGKVIFSDHDENCFPFIRINYYLNLKEQPEIRYLDWRKIDHPGKYSWIVASDIAYEPKYFPHIIRAFRMLLEDGGKILLTEPGRRLARPFFEMLEKNNFAFSMEKHQVTLNNGTSQMIWFHEIHRKG